MTSGVYFMIMILSTQIPMRLRFGKFTGFQITKITQKHNVHQRGK